MGPHDQAALPRDAPCGARQLPNIEYRVLFYVDPRRESPSLRHDGLEGCACEVAVLDSTRVRGCSRKRCDALNVLPAVGFVMAGIRPEAAKE